MRHPLLLPLLCAALLLGPVRAGRADDTDEARTLLTRAVKAHGGKETVAKYKAGQTKTKGKLQLPGVGEVEFTEQVAYMLPDRFKSTLEVTIAGQQVKVVTVVKGDKISIESGGMQVPITQNIKKALGDALYKLKTTRLASLLEDKGCKLTVLKPITVEGKEASGVRVSSKGHKDISLYFDKKSDLLVKVESRTLNAQSGKEITEERIILEYGKKSKEGIATPRKILVKHDGKKHMEVELVEVKYLEKLDDKEFTE